MWPRHGPEQGWHPRQFSFSRHGHPRPCEGRAQRHRRSRRGSREGRRSPVRGCKVPWLGTAPAGEGDGASTAWREGLLGSFCETNPFSPAQSTRMSCKQISGIHHQRSFPSVMCMVLARRASVSLLNICLALPEQAGRAAGVGSAPATHLIIYLELGDEIAPG